MGVKYEPARAGGQGRWHVTGRGDQPPYEVVLAPGMLAKGEAPHGLFDGAGEDVYRRLVVIDAKVDARYGAEIRAMMDRDGGEFDAMTVEADEMSKGMDSVLAIIEEASRLRRGDELVAIGGGNTLDRVGVAASMLRKGTSYVSIPTTGIGMWDAGPASKRAVNHKGRKSYLGAYQAPRLTICDRRLLASLEAHALRGGMAEAAKAGAVLDLDLFELVEQHGRDLIEQRFDGAAPADEFVQRAIGVTLREIADDPREFYKRRALDFGHFLSPILEMETDGEVSHGEAVAICCATTLVLARERGIDGGMCNRFLAMARDVGLPTTHPLVLNSGFAERAITAAVAARGAQHLVVPSGGGGRKYVEDAEAREFVRAAEILTDEVA